MRLENWTELSRLDELFTGADSYFTRPPKLPKKSAGNMPAVMWWMLGQDNAPSLYSVETSSHESVPGTG